MNIRWTPLALQDLQGISEYIEGRSTLLTANRVCRTIYNSIQRLRRFPESGKSGLEEETRELVVAEMPSYIVVYRIVRDAIEILRIWHSAQNR